MRTTEVTVPFQLRELLVPAVASREIEVPAGEQREITLLKDDAKVGVIGGESAARAD